MGTMEVEEKVEVAPLRLGTAVKGWVIIYGLTIVTNFILNAWMKAAPIGPLDRCGHFEMVLVRQRVFYVVGSVVVFFLYRSGELAVQQRGKQLRPGASF